MQDNRKGQADKQLLSRIFRLLSILLLLASVNLGTGRAALSTSSTFSSKDSELTLVGRPDCRAHPPLSSCTWSQGPTPIFIIGKEFWEREPEGFACGPEEAVVGRAGYLTQAEDSRRSFTTVKGGRHLHAPSYIVATATETTREERSGSAYDQAVNQPAHLPFSRLSFLADVLVALGLSHSPALLGTPALHEVG